MLKNNKGITLIALVVTIIIMLILAGIISYAIKNDGILTKAQEAKEKDEIARISEKLELQKAEVVLDLKELTIENYLEQIIKAQIIEEQDIEDTEDEGQKYVTVEDKYLYLIKDLENGDVKIEYQGKLDKVAPIIKDLKLSTKENSITVKVITRRAKGSDYKYYIKNIESGEEYSLKENKKSNEYTFEGLTKDKKYQIKVEVTNEIGTAEKERGPIQLNSITNLTTANITFDYSTKGWTNKDVTVTAKLNGIELKDGEKMQISSNGRDWEDGNSKTYSSNGTMYVQITNGADSGSSATATIEKIDKNNIYMYPSDNKGILIGDINSMELILSNDYNMYMHDGESGIGKIVYYYKNATEDKYNKIEEKYAEINGEEKGNTDYIFEASKKFTGLTPGKYNVYAEIYDVAGNVFTTGVNTTEIIEKETYEPEEELGSETKYFEISYNEDEKTAKITGVKDEYAVREEYYGSSLLKGIIDGGNYVRNLEIPSYVIKDGVKYQIKTIGESAFTGFGGYNTSGFYNVKIGYGIETIESYAFSMSTNLESIDIPNSVTKIGERAFSSCIELKSIKLPKGLEELEKCAFYNCTSLKTVYLSKNTKRFIQGGSNGYEFPFESCSSLADVYYSGSEECYNNLKNRSNGKSSYANKLFYKDVTMHYNYSY